MGYEYQRLTAEQIRAILASGGNADGIIDLSKMDLYGVNLCEANLSVANLRGADLRNTNLYGADLSWSNLSWSNLFGANLYGADLREADLDGANLRGANLSNVTMEWQSHNLIGTRLHQLALRNKNTMLNAMASMIIVNAQWCWSKFIDIFSDDIWADARQIAIAEIKTWVKEGDVLPGELKGLIDNG